MFFQKASDQVEEATAAEATVVVEVIQDHPEAPQDLMAVHQYAQAHGRLEQAPAEATAAALLAHHERVQHGQAVRYGKDRAR